MERKIKLQILLVLVPLLLLPAIVYSSSLGSFVKQDSVTIRPGDQLNFEVLFWNLGEPYYLEMEQKNIPENWSFSIYPNNFLLETTGNEKPPYDDGEYINLPGVGTIKPTKVKINIRIPESASEGIYDISFLATTSVPEKQISVSQKRDINFRVKVLEINEEEETQIEEDSEDKVKSSDNKIPSGIQQTSTTITENVNELRKQEQEEVKNEEKEQKNPMTGKIIKNLSNDLNKQNLIILLAVIFTILGSWVIYKYA